MFSCWFFLHYLHVLDDIFGSPVAKSLPTLPFQVVRQLLDVLPLTREEGRHLRQAMMDIKATHFILACLSVFTHQNCDSELLPGLQHEVCIAICIITTCCLLPET